MAWENFDEWTQVCDKKIKKIKNYYEDICNKDHGMFPIFINNHLDKSSDVTREVVYFTYFINRTITRYKRFIDDTKSSECINNQIQQIKKYNEKIHYNGNGSIKQFHDFINNSWGEYKKLKKKSENLFNNLYKNIEKIEPQSNGASELDNKILDNINKLEKSYNNNIEQLKIELKSANKNLKIFGEKRGVIRVAKLQRLILSSKGDFGLLYYLEKSFELIKGFFKSQSEYISQKEFKDLNFAVNWYYAGGIRAFLESGEGTEAKKIEKEVEDFFNKDSNHIDYKKLKGNFRDDKYYEQLNCFINFIEHDLNQEIQKYIKASVNFFGNLVSENSRYNEKKLNSEMKYVFKYILKKINSFCSNKKKKFKEQQKKESKNIVISGKTMDQIMDLLKCVAINNFLNTDKLKLKPSSNTLKNFRNCGYFLGFVISMSIIPFGVIALDAILDSACAYLLGVLSLVASSLVLTGGFMIGAMVVGTFFYESFKVFKHRKIKNKFKKFLKEQENDKDQDGNLPPAPTVTPTNEP